MGAGAFQMPPKGRKNAAKADHVRGIAHGDIIGVSRAARGNTGPEWLEAKVIANARGGFYDFEVEYRNPPPNGIVAGIVAAIVAGLDCCQKSISHLTPSQ